MGAPAYDNTASREETPLTIARRRQGALLAAGLIFTAGGATGNTHDTFLLAALVAAGGLLWSSRGWKSWLVATPMALAGLTWSCLDVTGCSIGARARLLPEKLLGHLPQVGWGELRRQALSFPCQLSPEGHSGLQSAIRLVRDQTLNGRQVELYQTPLGEFWIPGPGKELLTWLVWEIQQQGLYENGQVAIRAGDTVIDGGAHVGVFTRFAMRRNAGRVVAIEPDPTNIALLELNLASEIAAGRVLLVKAGIWDRKDFLTFSQDENSAKHSFVTDGENRVKTPGMAVLPLDEVVAQLGLDHVDFIKLDIEGAERRALEGARQVIGRFHPRMAICTYHLRDDATAIPAVVARLEPGYRIHAKDVEPGLDRFVTKVMFFE